MNKFQKLNQKKAAGAIHGGETFEFVCAVEAAKRILIKDASKSSPLGRPLSEDYPDNKSLEVNELASEFVDINLVLV